MKQKKEYQYYFRDSKYNNNFKTKFNSERNYDYNYNHNFLPYHQQKLDNSLRLPKNLFIIAQNCLKVIRSRHHLSIFNNGLPKGLQKLFYKNIRDIKPAFAFDSNIKDILSSINSSFGECIRQGLLQHYDIVCKDSLEALKEVEIFESDLKSVFSAVRKWTSNSRGKKVSSSLVDKTLAEISKTFIIKKKAQKVIVKNNNANPVDPTLNICNFNVVSKRSSFKQKVDNNPISLASRKPSAASSSTVVKPKTDAFEIRFSPKHQQAVNIKRLGDSETWQKATPKRKKREDADFENFDIDIDDCSSIDFNSDDIIPGTPTNTNSDSKNF